MLVANPLNVNVTVRDHTPLAIKLGIEFSVVLFTVVINRTLFIDFGSERLDEANVGVNTRLVIVIHAALVLVQTSEVLLEVKQLVLEDLVVTLTLSELVCLGHQLSDHSFLLGRSCSTRDSRCVNLRTADMVLNSSLACGSFNLSHVVARLLIWTFRAICPQWTSV